MTPCPKTFENAVLGYNYIIMVYVQNIRDFEPEYFRIIMILLKFLLSNGYSFTFEQNVLF